MIKAVFFDVDGTLLSQKQGKVPISTRRALRRIRKKGIKIFIATGRHMIELSKLPVMEIPFNGYLTLNGNLILDENKKLMIEEINDITDVSTSHSKESLVSLCKCLKRYPRFLNILIYCLCPGS